MALANILAPLFMKRPNDFPTPDEAVDAPDFSLWRHSRRARGEEKERRVLQETIALYISHISLPVYGRERIRGDIVPALSSVQQAAAQASVFYSGVQAFLRIKVRETTLARSKPLIR